MLLLLQSNAQSFVLHTTLEAITLKTWHISVELISELTHASLIDYNVHK